MRFCELWTTASGQCEKKIKRVWWGPSIPGQEAEGQETEGRQNPRFIPRRSIECGRSSLHPQRSGALARGSDHGLSPRLLPLQRGQASQ